MKRFFLRSPPALAALVFLCLLGTAFAATLIFPPLTGRVVDDANILSATTRDQLTEILAAHEQKTTNQIVVATLKSLQGDTIEDYGYQLGRAWGIGQKGKDNGAILIVAPTEHQVRIEVGYGLEGTLTDAQSKLIIENVILPAFRRGDFSGGVVSGTTAILQVLTGEPVSLAQAPQAAVGFEDNGGDVNPVWVWIGLFLMWLFFMRIIFSGLPNSTGRGAAYGSGFYGLGLGGGLGGGGFSGGGGSFGGGGASGGW